MITDYEHPYVTVDMVAFTIDKDWNLKVLLTKRKEDPFKDKWALPGGFVNIDENLNDCVVRKLQEKTELAFVKYEQLFTFGKVDRDPRGRVLSVSYFAPIPYGQYILELKENTAWVNVKDLPKLAFDHNEIIECAIRRIKGKLEYTNIAFDFLKDRNNFTIYELQKIYETIWEKKLDIPNFRRDFFKKYLNTGFVEETGKLSDEFSKRASKLYRCLKAVNEV